MITAALLLQGAPAPLPEVLVDRDNVEVISSCRLRFAGPVADADGNGVVQVRGSNIEVDLGGGTLAGAAEGAPRAGRAGVGIWLEGAGITLKNGSVRGFKVGVRARGCDGATIEDLNLSGNFGQRLASGREREDPADWLRPHENDAGEWSSRYGAGLSVEESVGVTVQRITVQGGQNGILLDRADHATVCDCDCSFNSGWGLALWRTSGSTICRNAFDFNIRGYSHGVYSRGQDSAGILLFEQCSNNLVALNSLTHSGDGIFLFAGREALGEVPPPREGDDAFHNGRGCNQNRFVANDCSFAAAHGIEATFSFGNVVERNRLEGNAICGLWGGYSRWTIVRNNLFTHNGEVGSGSERGGINIEHGHANQIEANTFDGDAVGIRLWRDEDPGLAATPWAKANAAATSATQVVGNDFRDLPLAIELIDDTGDCLAANTFSQVTEELRADEPSKKSLERHCITPTEPDPIEALAASLPGKTSPVSIVDGFPRSARASLGGREAIVMTEAGPWTHACPVLVIEHDGADRDVWRLLGGEIMGVQITGKGEARATMDRRAGTATVYGETPGNVTAYSLSVRFSPGAEGILRATGAIAPAPWTAAFFPLQGDPVADPESFDRAAAKPSHALEVREVVFPFGAGGPTELVLTPPGMPRDNFGMHAATEVTFPPGCWRVTVRSDDGIRVLVDGVEHLRRWDRHAPTTDSFTLEYEEPTLVDLVVDYFELDGHAEVSFLIDACEVDLESPGAED